MKLLSRRIIGLHNALLATSPGAVQFLPRAHAQGGKVIGRVVVVVVVVVSTPRSNIYVSTKIAISRDVARRLSDS